MKDPTHLRPDFWDIHADWQLAVLESFRERYSGIGTDDAEITDNGDVWFGNVQFPTGLDIETFFFPLVLHNEMSTKFSS